MTSFATLPEARMQEAWRLSRIMITLAERAKVDFAATVTPLGLPVPLARALTMLDEPAPMSDLAERLACDRSYITSLADQLEEQGLAQRTPGSDRRVKLLALTEEGRALRDRIAGAVSAQSMMLRCLDDSQRATLVALLEQLLDETAVD